ncbi:hypothetical protein KJ641_01235 [Patescibacteria group bacterium]|nr:hypothetical protein [Patescibacteria group bacterium]MBU1895475.1 hypothetical protein [Patescibacteria group bacterium]
MPYKSKADPDLYVPEPFSKEWEEAWGRHNRDCEMVGREFADSNALAFQHVVMVDRDDLDEPQIAVVKLAEGLWLVDGPDVDNVDD